MKLLFFFVCTSIQTFSQIQGKVKLERLIIDRDDPKNNLKMNTTIWYTGTKSIQEVPAINIETDSTGTYTKTSIKHYLLIDPSLQTYIYFSSFSDTSSIINYTKGINPFDKFGGWDLYSNKVFDYDSYIKITDTILDGVSYNRHRFRKIVDNKKNDFIIYTRCEKKRIPIKYLKPLGDKIGCPVIRMEIYFDGRLTGITQLHCLSETLTDAEAKVFQIENKYPR